MSPITGITPKRGVLAVRPCMPPTMAFLSVMPETCATSTAGLSCGTTACPGGRIRAAWKRWVWGAGRDKGGCV